MITLLHIRKITGASRVIREIVALCMIGYCINLRDLKLVILSK